MGPIRFCLLATVALFFSLAPLFAAGNTFNDMEATYPDTLKGKGDIYSYKLPKHQLTAIWHGKLAKISKTQATYLANFQKSLKTPEAAAFFTAFHRRIEVSIGKVSRWLLLQKAFVDAFYQEVYQGAALRFDVRFLGYTDGEPVYAVVKFQRDDSPLMDIDVLASCRKTKAIVPCFFAAFDAKPQEKEKIWQRNCQAGHSTSCFELGKLYRDQGKPKKEKSHYRLACMRGMFPLACNNYASLLNNQNERKKKMAIFRQACEDGLKLACENFKRFGS